MRSGCIPGELKDHHVPKGNLGILWLFLRGYATRIIFTLLFLIVARLASTADPLYLKQIIDQIGRDSPWAVIFPLVVVYFALRGATVVFEFLRDVIFSPVEMGLSRRVSETVFDHLLCLPMHFHSEQRTGGLARKISRGTTSIQFVLDFLVINALPTAIELILVTTLLVSLYPPVYGIITATTIVVYALFTVRATEYRQRFRLKANLTDDEATAIQVDTLTNISTIKYFNNEERQREKYRHLVGRWYGLMVASNNLFAAVSAGQSTILLVGLGVIFYLAVRQTMGGGFTIGDLVLLTTYIVRLATPIGQLGFVYRRLQDGMSDIDEMAKLLRVESTVLEPENPTPLPKLEGRVEFDRVSFAYPGREGSLKGVSMEIPAGSNVAIVGPSGAGKSTIVRLLFRFYDPTEGRILIDGVDLRELSRETRKQLMTIVPQEPVLFNDTIANNIRFGKPDAADQEVQRAAHLAHLDALIRRLPEGYETTVGERGVKLSGGEKQRVAIARAIIRDPKIVVFDEATSSLDTRSERAILSALESVSEGRTTISIAHRLSTVVNADRIFVLENGQVVEQGRHEELLKENGLYARLWRLQSNKGERVSWLEKTTHDLNGHDEEQENTGPWVEEDTRRTDGS